MTQPDNPSSLPVDSSAEVYELPPQSVPNIGAHRVNTVKVVDEVVAEAVGTETDNEYAAAARRLLDKLTRKSRELDLIYHHLIHHTGEAAKCEIRLNHAIGEERQARRDLDGAQAQDENHAPLPRQWAIAAFFLLPEWGACYLGAEAFGYGRVLTALLATLFLVILAGCEYWYDSAARQGGRGKKQKRTALGFLTGIIIGLGALRFYYSWITEKHSIVLALLFAAILSVVTAVLVAIGIIALRNSESLHVCHVRQKHKSAQRTLKNAKEKLEDAKEDEYDAEIRFHKVLEKDLIQEAEQSDLDPDRLRKALSEYVDKLRNMIARRVTREEGRRIAREEDQMSHEDEEHQPAR